MHEGAARLTVAIGDGHAARIVDEHGEEVLLRHRRLENQRRPEQTDEQHGERRQAERDEHESIAQAIGGRNAAIGEERHDRSRGHAAPDQQDGARERPRHVALLKHEGRIFEEETENVFHQALILQKAAVEGITSALFS